MAIDITNQEVIRKLDMNALIEDAIERKDINALRWLEDKSRETKQRTNKKTGTSYTANTSIVEIRAEYLRKYLGYVPQGNKNQEAAKARAKAKKEEAKRQAFEEAFKRMSAALKEEQ